MAFHKTRLGSFGNDVPCDINGYVPTEDTTAFELDYDHGTESTHDADGKLTEYGEWWEDDRFPEIKQAAIKATEAAEAGIANYLSPITCPHCKKINDEAHDDGHVDGPREYHGPCWETASEDWSDEEISEAWEKSALPS